jgi:hypothetical protein
MTGLFTSGPCRPRASSVARRPCQTCAACSPGTADAVGTDLVPPDQETEMVRRLFLVPRGFTNGVLVLSGDVDAALSLTGVESF